MGMGPYFNYVRKLGGREGAKPFKFVRIVINHLFIILDRTGREGGSKNFIFQRA